MSYQLDDHTEFDQLAVGWALYSLEPDDEAHFAAHLPTCPQCAGSVATLTLVLADLADALPAHDEPTPQLRDRIRNAIQHPPPQPTPRPTIASLTHTPPLSLTPDTPTPRRRWKQLATAAALAALVVGLGGWNVILHADRNQQVNQAQNYAHAIHDVTRPGARTADLTTTAGTPAATVILHDNTIGIVTVGIPENDPDTSTYVLWGMQPGHDQPKAIGTFDVTQHGINDSTVHLTDADTAFPTYAVSHEPGRHPPTQPSAIIASGRVKT